MSDATERVERVEARLTKIRRALMAGDLPRRDVGLANACHAARSSVHGVYQTLINEIELCESFLLKDETPSEEGESPERGRDEHESDPAGAGLHKEEP